MCGIAGAISTVPGRPVALGSLRSAALSMAARGPDGDGEWISESGDIALAHRRLAIIDLSNVADQPMHHAGGRYVISFNGEIYNYRELRNDLLSRGEKFLTESDTEVILALYSRDGAAMLSRLRGMFAFAIWDKADKTLFLARDTFGIKPLYYCETGGELRFASQVKALLADPAVSREPDAAGYAGFRMWGSVPEPHTMFRAIKALPAGHSLTVRQDGPLPSPTRYSSVASLLSVPNGTGADGRVALLDSVRHHLVADVEVGCFLSGGVDSGALVGLMRDAGQRHIRTITLAFDEFAGTRLDETQRAIEIAAHYGVDHTVARITAEDFHASMPAILAAMDQPSIDGVNSWFISRAAHEHGLKVALSGLGGDELLAGYPSFWMVPAMLARRAMLDRIPMLSPALRAMWRNVVPLLFRSTPKAPYALDYADTIERAYLMKRALQPPELLRSDPNVALLAEGLTEIADAGALRDLLDPPPEGHIRQIAALEFGHYMRNQLLRDVDWASMAHSLEVRVPLVDIPLTREMAGPLGGFGPNDGKRILANAPSLPLPTAIVEREKTGFSIPVSSWIGDAGSVETQRLESWGARVLDAYIRDTGLDLRLNG